MKFTTAILLALPALSLAHPLTKEEPAPATRDLAICEEEAGSYSRYCPRCEHLCASQTGEVYKQCLYSVFMTINYNDSQCWQQGGRDCANRAVDKICGTS